MGAPDRIVRHLRLRAHSEASVRRTARKLEDALRCASLPDAGARVLLVRRLDLGRIAAGASPQTLSLLLEQRVAAAGTSWVHGATPEAERAGFVYFRDALEARCELALRLAKGAPCAAWYWPLAAPELVPGEGARASLRRIALAIASLPEAPAALPAWVARLAAAGAGPALASAVAEAEATALLRAAGVPLYTMAVPAPSEASPAGVPPGAEDAETRSGSQQPRVGPELAMLPPWVRTLAAAGSFAAPVQARRARSRARPDPRGGLARTTVPATRPSPSRRAGSVAGPDAAPEVQGRARTGVLPDPDRLGGSAPRAPAAEEAAPASDDPSSRHVPTGAPRSAYGGLLFLAPVLQRLGYAAWAETLPGNRAPDVVSQLFALLLRRLSAPLDDPAWLMAAEEPQHGRGGVGVWPAGWSDPIMAAPRGCAARDLLALGRKSRTVAELSDAWLLACRRWLRRSARIGVASLVTRPASLGITATHIDVFFRPEDADMRVRRAGLDIDPGWLPWLGRVVAFHYGSEG